MKQQARQILCIFRKYRMRLGKAQTSLAYLSAFTIFVAFKIFKTSIRDKLI
ncbi:hypothetical protein SAMN05216357_109133 [Porphyromonadaceae bacterium KH3CP3RA]|nr:hypothetical protein SAMN05216357_109133 [Porphyromonadaceae bacterium KH3CP3RA]